MFYCYPTCISMLCLFQAKFDIANNNQRYLKKVVINLVLKNKICHYTNSKKDIQSSQTRVESFRHRMYTLKFYLISVKFWVPSSSFCLQSLTDQIILQCFKFLAPVHTFEHSRNKLVLRRTIDPDVFFFLFPF